MPNTTPLESQEAKALVAYLRVRGFSFMHIPSETGSDPAARRRAVRMKQQGTSAGFPDYLVIVKKQIIFIELKRQKGSVVSPDQRKWLQALTETGAPCFIAHGAHEAIEAIEEIESGSIV